MPTLVVQLGHCYRKSGATGTTGEQEYAAKVGDACKALLHGRGGWSVRLILADDPASWYQGDAFFAIHCDGSTSTAARGASVGYRTPEGQIAAQAWKRAYAARGWPGFRPDNYTPALAQYYGTGTAVNKGNRRAVILECGFRTNPEDRALLDGAGGPERVALSIGDALGIPVIPAEEDMATPQEIATAVWSHPLKHLDPANNTVLAAWIWLVGANMGAWDAAGDDGKIVEAIRAHVDGKTLAVLNAISGIATGQVDVPALAGALSTALGPDLGRQVADELGRRIQEGN